MAFYPVARVKHEGLRQPKRKEHTRGVWDQHVVESKAWREGRGGTEKTRERRRTNVNPLITLFVWTVYSSTSSAK
jgi:ribosomal protein L32E